MDDEIKSFHKINIQDSYSLAISKATFHFSLDVQVAILLKFLQNILIALYFAQYA